MADIIATIRLVDGETGYYDEKSDIYLNWKHPIKDVLKGTDCSGLRTSVRFGRIKVIAGSLGQDKSFKQILMEAKSKRTGIPLKKLMGKSPIVTETEPQEVINKPATSDDTPATETPVEKPKVTAPKKTAAKVATTTKTTANAKNADDTKTTDTKASNTKTSTKAADTAKASDDTKADAKTDTASDKTADSDKKASSTTTDKKSK